MSGLVSLHLKRAGPYSGQMGLHLNLPHGTPTTEEMKMNAVLECLVPTITNGATERVIGTSDSCASFERKYSCIL